MASLNFKRFENRRIKSRIYDKQEENALSALSEIMTYTYGMNELDAVYKAAKGQWFDISEGSMFDSQGVSTLEYLRRDKIIPSACPNYCLSVNISLEYQKLNSLTDTFVTDVKSLMPLDQLHDEFGLGMERDPETLDDSDLEILAEQSGYTKAGSIPKKFGGDSLSATVVVNEDTIHLLGSSDEYTCPSYVTDCKVLKGCKKNEDDLVLMTTDNEKLCAIIFDENLKPVIIQWWNLAVEGDTRGTWRIAIDHKGGQFGLFSNTLVKFFKRRDRFHCELVNNLYFEESRILSCCFLQGKDFNDHSMMFLSVLRLQRLIYCICEWDSFQEEKKEVYPLTLLSGEVTQLVLPLNQNRCLLWTKNDVQLVSANQIMSGDPSFRSLDRSIFGTPMESYFEDPELLSKLQNSHPDLSQFTHCSVFATSNGALCCCLVDSNDEIRFLGLTRFKGLKNIFKASNDGLEFDQYRVFISSFGKVFELILDLTGIGIFSKDYKIPSLKNICKRRTVDAGYPNSETLMLLTSARRPRDDASELWLTSQSTLSHLTPDGYTQSVTCLVTLKSFEEYNMIHVVEINNLDDFWKSQFQDHPDTLNSHDILLIGTNMSSESRAFLINPEYQTLCEGIVELDDILPNNSTGSLLFFISAKKVVQVSKSSIFVDNLEDGSEWHKSPQWEIDGAIHCGQRVVVWNKLKSCLLLIDDINMEGDLMSFELQCPLNSKFQVITDVSFLEEGNDTSLLVACSGILYIYRCGLMMSNDILPTRILDSFKAHFLATHGHQVVISNQDGEIFVKYEVGVLSSEAFYKINPIPRAREPYELRFYGQDTCLLFTPKDLKLLNFENRGLQPITFPDRRKTSSIIEVKVSKGLIFVLFNDGLEIVKTSYVTRAPKSIVVKSTRSIGKKYVFLRKINRMLIMDTQKKTMDCAKLENGKLMSLDSRALRNFETISDIMELQDETSVTSLVISGSEQKGDEHSTLPMTKIIQIIPRPGRLSIKELLKKRLTESLRLSLKAISSRLFWAVGDKTATLVEYADGDLQINREFKLESNEIRSFDAIHDLIVVISTNSDIICEKKMMNGDWVRLDGYDRATSTLYDVRIVGKGYIVISAEKEEFKSSPGVLLLFKIENDTLECCSTVSFPSLIKDYQYCPKTGRMYVLLSDGSIEILKAASLPFPNDDLTLHQTVPTSADIPSQIGCWPMNKWNITSSHI